MKQPEPAKGPLPKSERETSVITRDRWAISLPKTNIHTLDQLVEYCQVDLSEWTIERFVVNKWEMGFVKDSIVSSTIVRGKQQKRTEHKEAGSQPLYQVKAFLKHKKFQDLEAACTDNAKLRSRLEKQNIAVKNEREIAKRLAQNHAGFDDLLENMEQFSRQMGNFTIAHPVFKHKKAAHAPAVSEGHTEDAVLLLSDTHFGDRIRREDTSGFPEFDLIIAGNRMGYVIRQVKQVLTLHRAMYPLKKLHVWVGGDIGNGELYDAPKSNQLFLPAQVMFSYNMLKFAIEDLLTLTEGKSPVIETVELLFTVGNHMRMDEKMPTKLQAQRTLDWLIYQVTIEHFKDHPNIAITQEMSPYIFKTIRGHRHLFAHGNQVGYRNSPDAQCKSMGTFIDRVRALFDSPEFRRKNGLAGETFSRICIGDIHVPVSFPRLISNGSLNGQNELGVNWALEPIPAGQQLFGVSDTHIETWRYFLDCTAVQKSRGDMNRYGRFAKWYLGRMGR